MRTPQPRERGLARRENWPHYILGMLSEAAFVLALTAVALVIAIIAKAVF